MQRFFLTILLLFTPVALMAQEAAGPPVEEKEAGPASEKQARQKPSPRPPGRHYTVVVQDSASLVPSLSLVTTKLPVAMLKTPASVSVVNQGLFEGQAADVLGDALRNVSGAVAHTGFGVHDFFTLRGFDSLSSGLVLTDGAPEPEVTFYHLYNIDRVEVLKGPGAFLYGGNALSGSVNLVRKKPRAQNFFNGGGSIGSYETFRGYIDLNRSTANGKAAFRLNLFGRDSNGYRDDKENRQWAINPSASFRLNERSLLTLDFEYVSNNFASDSGIPLVNNQLPDVPRKRSYQTPFDFSEQDLYRVRVDFISVLNSVITLRNKFYFTDLDWQSNGTLFPFTLPDQEGRLTVFRNLVQLDDRQKLFGNQFEALIEATTGPVRHNLMTGFEVSRLTDDFTIDPTFLPPIDLNDPVETAQPPFFTVPGQSQAGNASSVIAAPYVVDQISFSDRFQLFVGGRLDIVSFKDREADIERDDTEFSPFVGAVYSPFEGSSIYANFGQAFAPPSSRDQSSTRRPEESTQGEVGYKQQWLEGRLQTSAAFYHLKRRNTPIPDDNGLTVQTGSQRSRGIELEAAGELLDSWYVFVNYAYTDADLTEFSELVDRSLFQLPPIVLDRSGNRPAFAPENLFNLWTVKEFSGGFSLGGGLRYVGDQFIAEDNQFVIDGALLVDAVVAYRFEQVRLSLNLKNLTDRETATRGFGSTSVIPAEGFNVQFGVHFSLQ